MDIFDLDLGFDYLTSGIIFVIFILVLFSLFFIISIYVATIIGKWKVLKKAGKNGWEAIVPIYNELVLCEISGVNQWWVLIKFIASIFVTFPIFGPFITQIVVIYFKIILDISIAKSFGKDAIFGLGLLFLPPVFWLILSGKDNEYIGKNKVDPVMDFIYKENNNNKTNINKNGYCKNCGAAILDGANFCKNCGSKLDD